MIGRVTLRPVVLNVRANEGMNGVNGSVIVVSEAPELKNNLYEVTLDTFQPDRLYLYRPPLTKLVVLKNILDISVTAETVHVARLWLNAVAPENILDIFVTFVVVHVARLWLNAVAPENILDIFVTAETVQVPIAPLNAVAPANILDIFVTAETVQLLRLWLNAVAP